ncbi:MAG TPA: phage/plasmid primase, P4 family [Vicinamibacterales bacterium]|nr:phage/plasmid primase, P4 family [Vicinamibacterales bacterium]
MTTSTLTHTDLERHAALGIPADLLTRAQVRRVTDPEARELLALNGQPGDFAGLEYPYLDPRTGYRVTSRVRRDHPPLKADGSPDGKYFAGFGDNRHLYFAPGADVVLHDASALVVVVESEKAALAVRAAAARAGRAVLVVATGGCWGWRGRIGKTEDASGTRVDVKGVLSDVELVAWHERPAVIAFDGDATTNSSVAAARRALTTELRARGAQVRAVDLPSERGVNGPDDYIGTHGDAAFWTLLDTAPTEARVLDSSDPLPTARAFVADAHTTAGVLGLRHQSGVFYAHNGSMYSGRDEGAVRADVYRFLEPAKQRIALTSGEPPTLLPFRPTKTKVENVLDALRAVCNLPAASAAPCWLQDDPGVDPFDVLPLHNGLLHIPTRTLLPATPAFFALNGLEFSYEPDAAAPTHWLQFLSELWGDDDESRDTLQELIGYLLTPRTHFQKIAMLVGPRRSGKGTIARVTRKLLGDRNVCGPTLANMSEQFGLSVLINKTAAIIADARIGGRTDTAVITERLLSVSGEDTLSIPRKFLPDWNGKLTARFLLLTNELPRIEDASGALSSRFVLLALHTSFYGREDHGLLDRFIPELPGILNWALDGYDRLYARGRFVQPQSSAALIQEFEDLGSPIGAFVRDRCDVGRGFEVMQMQVFEAWKSWCQENGRDKPGTIQTLGRNLRAAVPWLQSTQPRVMGTQVRYWQGLRLKADTR